MAVAFATKRWTLRELHSLPDDGNKYELIDGELLRLEYDEFVRFSHEEVGLARDLLFALARVLSNRLRNTTVRVRR